MKEYTNFRIIYLNLNLIYMCLAVFVFYKCTFDEILKKDGKKLYALGLITTIHALIAGYVGCSAIWFRSKTWTQIQILTNIAVIPFLVLAYVFKKITYHTIEDQQELCEYLMIGLFAFGISLIFIGYKYVEVFRKELANKLDPKATNALLWPRNEPNGKPMGGLYLTASLPSIYESDWNLAPFGRLNTIEAIGSTRSMASSCPAINLIVTPNQLDIIQAKDNVRETKV